jgi:hypothetical protein
VNGGGTSTLYLLLPDSCAELTGTLSLRYDSSAPSSPLSQRHAAELPPRIACTLTTGLLLCPSRRHFTTFAVRHTSAEALAAPYRPSRTRSRKRETATQRSCTPSPFRIPLPAPHSHSRNIRAGHVFSRQPRLLNLQVLPWV